MRKAKTYKVTVNALSDKDLNKIERGINKEVKELRKHLKEIKLEKIESEKLKKIKPIEIKASEVFLFISIFSSLFLIGGFLYTKFLLGFFGISTSHFFEISDYLSSSVDIIFPVFLSTLVGVVAYFRGFSLGFSEEISTEQFGTKILSRNFLWIHVLAIVSVILFGYSAIIHEVIIPSYLFFPIVWFLGCIVTDFFNIDKYIKNKLSFNAVTIAFIVFVTYVGVLLLDTIIKVEDGRYESPYIVSFQNEYIKYRGHDFFLANSQYIFLLNKKTKEIVVIPKIGIKAIHAKK